MCEEFYCFPVKVHEIKEHEIDDVGSGLTYVEIGNDYTKPDGVARNALSEKFSVHKSDADWLAIEEEAKKVEMYLKTLGIKYEKVEKE